MVAKDGRVATSINAGLRPPPPAAYGVDSACHPAADCHQEVDGKVRPIRLQMSCRKISLRHLSLGGNTKPDAPPRTALNGEWGLSMHAQSHRGDEERNVLVDFGYTPEVLLNNMSILKIDPATFDALVLSHGHYDHFGGMVGFLAANKDRLKRKIPFFVGGEDAFCIRRTATGGQFGALDRKAIIDADLILMMSEGPAIVADHAFTSRRIGQTSFEKPLLPTSEIVGIFDGFGCFPEKMPTAKNTGTYIPDDFDHEIATNYLVKGKGLVVLSSCSHRGVINAVKRAQEVSGVDKVHAVIGGFHIVPPLGDDYIRQTIEAFKEIDPDILIPAHCTGDAFMISPAKPWAKRSFIPRSECGLCSQVRQVPGSSPSRSCCRNHSFLAANALAFRPLSVIFAS